MEPSLIIKNFGADANSVFNDNDMTVVHMITTQTVDSDKEVVLSSGLDFSRMNKTRSVLFNHDPYDVVAKMVWVKAHPTKEKCTGWQACTKFADTDHAKDVYKLCKGGFINGWSIGMDWYSMKYCSDDEHVDMVRKNPDFATAKRIIKEATIMEYSSTPIPANPDALTSALRSGVATCTKTIRCIERFLETGVEKLEAAVKITDATDAVRNVEGGVRRVPLSKASVEKEIRSVLRAIRGID